MDEALISLVNWSRAQFALTAMYHWLFVPLTLGLTVMIAFMETLYVRTGDEGWKNATKFWMRIFGVNFAIGVATGLILEFEFGTNWSNYSWFVGDIFGAPLAIEGIMAFFMEATFIAVMAHRARCEYLGAVDPCGQQLDAIPRGDGIQPGHGAQRDGEFLGGTLLPLSRQ